VLIKEFVNQVLEAYMLRCIKNVFLIAPFIFLIQLHALNTSSKCSKIQNKSLQSARCQKLTGDVILPGIENNQNCDIQLIARRPGSLQRMGKQANISRNYNTQVTPKEKKDIRFIVKTLSDSTLPSLWTKKKELEKAGDRIDHLHPLKFYTVIFSDEELKVSLMNIRTRSWVWGEFFSGMSEALADEKKANNLTIPQIEDFCNNLGVDKKPIIAALNENRWTDFVDNLIAQLPRKNNPGRHDL
jgi:hypothetical protein